jgi:hypothetical protein
MLSIPPIRARLVQQDHDAVGRILVLAERGEEREEPLESGGAGREIRLNVAVAGVAKFDLEDAVCLLVAIHLGVHDVVGVEHNIKVVVLTLLRPSQKWRSCASDFALALVADEQGRLGNIDLTLSEP